MSRIALICSSLLIFLVTIALLCGGNTLACISVMTTDGIVAIGWLIGATALGTLILRRFQLETNWALFTATAGGLGLGIFSLLGLGLGLLGWLNRPIAIAFPGVSVLWFTIDLYFRTSGKGQIDRAKIEEWLRAPAGVSWLWLVPVVSLAMAGITASLMPGVLWRAGDPHPYDVTSYHLLVPREWFEGGRIVPLPHNVFSYFTFNVEMQFLLLMHATGGPWAGMYACQFVSTGYAVLMVIGVYGSCNGRKDERRTLNVECRTSKSENSSLQSSTFNVQRSTVAFNISSIVAAAIASTVPWVIMLAGVAYVESALMLYTALSVAWALHAIATPKHFCRSVILSGLMAGFACGVKITAVPMLLIAVPTALLIVLLVRRSTELPVKKILIGCVGLGLAGSVVLSPWLIRNFVWCGNPVFPVGMKMLGHDHFTSGQIARFNKEHSPTFLQKPLANRFTVLGRDVVFHPQYGWLLLPLGLIACALRWRSRETWLLLVCSFFVLVVWIGFTHAIPRFLVMLIPIAAIAAGRIQWGRGWPVAIVLLLVSAGVGWSFMIPQLRKESDPPLFNGLPRPALFGPTQLDFMMPLELIDAHNRDPQLQIALIGDAQVFLYQIPMSQMHYRSVFNVAAGTDDPIDAWIGPQVRGDRNWLLVINPMEIDRLHRTYDGIPPLPGAWEPPDPLHPKSFFLRGDQLPGK